MKKSVFTLVTFTLLSVQSFADSCGAHNLIGEWTRQTALASTPDAKCGKTLVTEKTVFTFVSSGGKVSGHGLRVSVKSFENQSCASKSKSFKYPTIKLLADSRLSIFSEDGAQVVSNCDVSSDRSKLNINGYVYQ